MSPFFDPGWMGWLLKVVVFVVLALAGTIIEHRMVDWLGNFGAWVERLLTLGRHKPDPESWFSIIFGFVLTVIVVVAATGYFISQKQAL